MHVLVICPHPERRSPGQRLKFEQYYPSWRAAGHQVDVRPFWAEGSWETLYSSGNHVKKALLTLRGYARRLRDLRDALRADVVYLFLEAWPLGPPWFERILARRGVPLVYDVDDFVHLPHGSRANWFMRYLRKGTPVLERMARADHVIVCTDYLEGVARERNQHVTNISSTIDTRAYQPRNHNDRTDGVVVGWSGSHSTSPYLHLLDDVLRELQRTDDIRIKVIGDASFRIEDAVVDAQDWKLETEVADLSEIDIGVYPLPDDEWILGKSGLKALQYMGLGIPTVAARAGMNLRIIDHGRNGFLAATREEWLANLRRLIHDPELRRRVGAEGRRTVVERYSVQVTESVYLGVLRDATGQQRTESAA